MAAREVPFVPRPFVTPAYVPETQPLMELLRAASAARAAGLLARGQLRGQNLINIGTIIGHALGEYRGDRQKRAILDADQAMEQQKLDRADQLARDKMAADAQDRAARAAEPIALGGRLIDPQSHDILYEPPPEPPKPDAPFTLGPGQTRFEGAQPIASVPAADRPAPTTPNPTEASLALLAAEGNIGAQKALAIIRAQHPETGAKTYEWVTLDNGQVVQVEKGTAPPGSKPYSAAASQGLAAAQVQVRNRRAAAALNSVEKLKQLAPQRSAGPMGILEGAADVAAGYAGYHTQARQFQALIGPTAMQMAVAVQGAANLSDTERKTMAEMLGSIHTMDYESQIALLQNATDLIRNGADVQQVEVKDPTTGRLVKTWREAPRSTPGQPMSVTLPAAPASMGPKEGDTKPIDGYPGTEQTFRNGKWIRTK